MGTFEEDLISKLDAIETGKQAATSGSESYNQLDSKLNSLNTSLQEKSNRLNIPIEKTMLLGIQDADTPILPSGSLRESSTSGVRYDAVELKHDNKPYDMIGIDKKQDTDFGKSKYSMELQRKEVATLLGKNVFDVTEQDMIDVGNQQQIQKLADIVRSQDEPRWEAPLIRNVEQTNLTGKYVNEFGEKVDAPLNIPVGVAFSGSKDNSGKREIGSIINAQTGENITDLSAEDKDLNASYTGREIINNAIRNSGDSLNEELAKPYTDTIYSDNRFANMVDALQYGLGSKGAKVIDTSADAGLRIAKGLMSGTEEEKNAKINDILSGTSADKYVSDKGDFTGLDKYKEAREYGYDNRRVQAEMKKAGDAFESGNVVDIAKSLASVIMNAGPELLLESSGEMVLGAARLPGFLINAASYNNEILENREKITGQVADEKDRLIAGTGAVIMSALNKIGTDELLGKSTFAKDAVGALSKIGTADQVKAASITLGDKLLDATRYLGKSTAENIARGTGEGLEEVFQDLTQTIAEKLDTKEQDKIFSSDTYKQLFQSFAGGFGAGSTMASASETKDMFDQAKDKITGKALKEKIKSEIDDREKYAFTQGENWTMRPGSVFTKDTLDAKDIPTAVDELYYTRDQIKNKSAKSVADAMYGEKELKDIKGNTVDPKTGLNSMLDSLRDSYFAENKINDNAKTAKLAQIDSIQDADEKLKAKEAFDEQLKNEKISKTNSYVNDYMYSYISMIDKLNDTGINVSDEKRKEAQDLATNEFIGRIHSEPDEYVKNKLLASFTNDFVNTLADKLFAKKEDIAKGKATEKKSFGSLEDIDNSELYGETGKEYIQQLKDVKNRIFGSQEINDVNNPIEKEFNDKIKNFESKYIEYQDRLKQLVESGKTKSEAITMLNVKTADDVANEILDGSGFIVNIRKPAKKSINGHMQNINKNIANIKYTANESVAQGNRIEDLLKSVDGLTNFSDTRSKNNDSYDSIVESYSPNMTLEEKKKLAKDVMNEEAKFTNISKIIKEGNPSIDEEVRALRAKGLPVYRVGLDRLKPVVEVINGQKVEVDKSTGSRMIKEGEAFIASMNEVKAMLQEKINLKNESLLNDKLPEKVSSSLRKDIEVLTDKIASVDESIIKQVNNIKNINKLMTVMKDPTIAYERSQIISKLKQSKTPGSKDNSTENVQSIQSEPEIDDMNYDTSSETEFIVDEPIENIEQSKITGDINETRDETIDEQTRETTIGKTDSREENRNREIKDGNREGQTSVGIKETTDTGAIETTNESIDKTERSDEIIEQKSSYKKPDTQSRKEYFKKKDEELYVKVSEKLESGKSISKTTEEVLADEKAKKEQELIDSKNELESIYVGLESELKLGEINKELKQLNEEIADMLNPSESIEKLTTIKQVKTESINKLKKVSKVIADKTALLMKESANLIKNIKSKESSLEQLEIELSEALNILSEDEKLIVRETKNKVKIQEQIVKNKSLGIKNMSKVKKTVDEAKAIKEKIKVLTNIIGSKGVSSEKKNEINSRIRKLEIEKLSIKHGSNSPITKAYADYVDTLNELDIAESKQDIQELTYKSKVDFRRYKNELAVDKDIRARVKEQLSEVLANETDEVLKSGLENAINGLDNYLPGYQDLINNDTKYSRSSANGIIEAKLVRNMDMPNYLKAYIELDDNMKGQIKLKKGNNLITRLSAGTKSIKDADKLRTKVLDNFYAIKGKSYQSRIDKEYPVGSEARKVFEDTLYADLSVVTRSKFIDTSLTLQKPISAITSGSDETMQDIVDENVEPEKKDNSELKKLDNPTITIEQGKIVARDSENNMVDIDKYSINIMALLFGKDEKGYAKIPDYAEEILKIETIKEIGNMYKILLTDANEDDGKKFDEIWGIDGTNDFATDLRQQVIDNYVSKGMIPESVIVKSLGRKIYKALPMSFDKNTIEQNTEDIISSQLGLYAIGALSRQKSEIQILNEDGTFTNVISGITRYASKEDVAIENNNEIKSFKNLKENKSMIALVETSWNVKKDSNGNDIVHEDGNIEVIPSISPLRVMKLPIDLVGQSMKRISETLEYTDETSIGNVASFSPITEVSDNIKNKITDKSEIAKETILDYQSIEYKFTDNVRELYEMWKNPNTRNTAYKFANILDPNEDKLNIKQYKSRLAKNRNSRLELDSLMRFYEEAGTDKGFYLKWDMIASGRYMIDSSISPQASKITRFLVSTKGTRTEIEFTNGKVSEEILGGIKRSLAQALDYGLDKDLDTYVIAKMEKDFEVKADGTVEFNKTENAKTIKIIYDAFRKSIADESYELSNYEISRLTKLNEQGEGFHAVQVIRELARFSNEASIASGSESHKYDAHFVIEADGITSGMMITLAQIMTDDSINLFEKGGIYTDEAVKFWTGIANKLGLEKELEILGTSDNGNKKITHGLLNRIGKMLSEPENRSKLTNEEFERANFKDFYNTIAGAVTKNLSSIKDELSMTMNDESRKESDRNRAALGIALINVVGDKISRNMAKDPVMVFIYGSSLGSIKNKILNGLIVESLQEIINDKEFVRKYGNNNDVLGILSVIGVDVDIDNKTVSVGARTKIEQVVGEKGNKSLEPVKVDIVRGKKTVGIDMLKNIVIDGRMMKNLFFASFNTYGKAFEQGFDQNFNFINRYRDIIKSLEVIRFQVFDVKFKNKVESLIAEKSYTDKDGIFIEYNPTNSELDKILKDLTNKGYGHAIKDINGGYHSFEKTEKSELDKRTSLRTIERTPTGQFIENGDNSVSNAVGIRKHVVNTGAAPVTSIHNQDGWQIRYATMKNGIQNVFDAEITGLDNHNDGVYTYNEGFSIANTKHSILQSQLVDMENIINSLSEDEKTQMFSNFSEKQAKDIIATYEKMRNIDDATEVYRIEGLEGSDRKRDNIDAIDELRVSRNNIVSNSKQIVESLSKPIEVAINHLYATDTGKQYVGKLGGFKNEKADIDMVINTYYDIIANAMKRLNPDIDISRSDKIDSKMNAKYVVENKITNQDSVIKKFEKLLNDKSIKDEDKAEIRDIIEKLVNCKP